MLTASALSQNHRGARRLSLKRDRQRYRQGDERRKAGELDRWVVMMRRGERERHTAPICFFFFLHHSFALFYLSTCQIYFFSTFILFSFSFVHCQFSSLSLFLCLSSYSMTRLFFFIQVRIIRCLFFILWMWENIWLRQFGDFLQGNDTFPLIPLFWEKHATC